MDEIKAAIGESDLKNSGGYTNVRRHEDREKVSNSLSPNMN